MLIRTSFFSLLRDDKFDGNRDKFLIQRFLVIGGFSSPLARSLSLSRIRSHFFECVSL